MATEVLSHHHIVELAAPFRGAGWRLDLTASDRAAGRLRFGPRREEVHGRPMTVTLDWTAHTLVRRAVAEGNALAAEWRVHGGSPAARLTRLREVPLAAQWRFGDGWAAALDFEAGEFSPPRLVRAEAGVGPLALTLLPPGRARRSARVELKGHTRTTLPDDLLAVLGWSWSPLVRHGAGWRGSVRVRPGGVEARLHQAAEHLSRTLAAPPAAFHARHAPARWRVLARRSVPLLLWTLVLALAGLAPELRAARDSLAPLVALLLPPALLGLFVLTAESPRLEVPPAPQPLRDRAW